MIPSPEARARAAVSANEQPVASGLDRATARGQVAHQIDQIVREWRG